MIVRAGGGKESKPLEARTVPIALRVRPVLVIAAACSCAPMLGCVVHDDVGRDPHYGEPHPEVRHEDRPPEQRQDAPRQDEHHEEPHHEL